MVRKQSVTFWLVEWQGIGGAAAKSLAATQYLLKQVEELASNRDQQPVYIQWNATAQPSPPLNASELHDGWYVIDTFEPTYSRYIVAGIVQCRMTVTAVAPAPPYSVAMAYAGGALASDFSGAAVNLITLPGPGSAATTTPVVPEDISFFRPGNAAAAQQGQMYCIQSPAVNPEPFVPAGTIGDWFKNGVEVFDTISPFPTFPPPSNGSYVDSHWVRVFDKDHDFVGDCVVTNGLLLLTFVAGSGGSVGVYLWNTSLSTQAWQFVGNVNPYAQDGNASAIRAFSLSRVGLEEVAIACDCASATQAHKIIVRLQRGRYEGRVDLIPKTQDDVLNLYLNFALAFANRVVYNPTKVGDAALGEGALAVDATYGYGAAFTPSAAYPFIAGWLYVNKPGANQPNAFGNASLTLGDTVLLKRNDRRSYGFFAIPYGVGGSFSTANLLQEMESATLSGGFVSAADAGASGGNAAKLPSGTVPGAIAIQAGWTPHIAIYDCWARMRVTSNASGTNQLQVGFFDGTAGSYLGSTTYKPSDLTTSYAWYRVATGITTVGAHSQEFRAVGVTNNAATDFWIDEMVLVPKSGGGTWPQDIWQQFMYDRSVRMIRP